MKTKRLLRCQWGKHMYSRDTTFKILFWASSCWNVLGHMWFGWAGIRLRTDDWLKQSIWTECLSEQKEKNLIESECKNTVSATSLECAKSLERSGKIIHKRTKKDFSLKFHCLSKKYSSSSTYFIKKSKKKFTAFF